MPQVNVILGSAPSTSADAPQGVKLGQRIQVADGRVFEARPSPVTAGRMRYVEVTGNTSALAVQYAAADLGSASGWTLSDSNNRLTRNSNGAASALWYVLLSGSWVGQVIFVHTSTAADGLWLVEDAGSDSTPIILTRPSQWRSFAALPRFVSFNLGSYVLYALVELPGAAVGASGGLPYIRADYFADANAHAIAPSSVSPVSALGGVIARIPQVLEVALSSGGSTGTADDVSFTVPYACKVLRAWADVTTPGASGATLQVQAAAGGGGTKLCSAIHAEVAGRNLEDNSVDVPGSRSLSAGTYYVRRADRSTVGTLYVMVTRT